MQPNAAIRITRRPSVCPSVCLLIQKRKVLESRKVTSIFDGVNIWAHFNNAPCSVEATSVNFRHLSAAHAAHWHSCCCLNGVMCLKQRGATQRVTHTANIMHSV